MARELIVSRGRPLRFNDTPPATKPGTRVSIMAAGMPLPLSWFMSNPIRAVLAQCDGRVEGEKGAARLLTIHPSIL